MYTVIFHSCFIFLSRLDKQDDVRETEKERKGYYGRHGKSKLHNSMQVIFVIEGEGD